MSHFNKNDSSSSPKLHFSVEGLATGLLLGTQFGDCFGIAYECGTYEGLTRVRYDWLRKVGASVDEGNFPIPSKTEVEKGAPKSGPVNMSVVDKDRKNLDLFEYAEASGHPMLEPGFSKGDWTDDTQLTMSSMRALGTYFRNPENDNGLEQKERNSCSSSSSSFTSIRMIHDANPEFFYHLAKEHVVEHQRSLNGWGGTKNAVERLYTAVGMTASTATSVAQDAATEEGQATHEKAQEPRNFSAHLASGNPLAVGNGVLMKVTPLCLYAAFERHHHYRSSNNSSSNKSTSAPSTQKSIQLWDQVALMTHGSPLARLTAIVHCELLTRLFERYLASSSSSSAFSSPQPSSFSNWIADLLRSILEPEEGLVFHQLELFVQNQQDQVPSKTEQSHTAWAKAKEEVVDGLRQTLDLVIQEGELLSNEAQSSSEQQQNFPNIFHPAFPPEKRQKIEQSILQHANGASFHCLDTIKFFWAYLGVMGSSSLCFSASTSQLMLCGEGGKGEDSSSGAISSLSSSFASTPHEEVARCVAYCALLGGDTDSTAALVGGVLGAFLMGRETTSPICTAELEKILYQSPTTAISPLSSQKDRRCEDNASLLHFATQEMTKALRSCSSVDKEERSDDEHHDNTKKKERRQSSFSKDGDDVSFVLQRKNLVIGAVTTLVLLYCFLPKFLASRRNR